MTKGREIAALRETRGGGLEPPTTDLTGRRSTIELPPINQSNLSAYMPTRFINMPT